MRRARRYMLMSSSTLRWIADEIVVGYGRARLGMELVGIVDVVLAQQMVIVHRRGLAGVIDRTCARVQQQIIIVASWMRPRRPTTGHGAAGEADTLGVVVMPLRH